MVDEKIFLELVAAQAATSAKVESLHPRIDEVISRLARAEANQERGDDELEASIRRQTEGLRQEIAAQSQRIGSLERWQAKVIGIAFGVGIGSGALSAYITQALTSAP